MIILSQAFKNKGFIPEKFSYKGGNVSPPLIFEEIPEDAQSLVLICHDIDALKSEGFTHWLMWNISPTTNAIYENTVPKEAVVGLTDWGENDWGGPAPSPGSGTHRYVFSVYALNQLLHMPESSNRNEILQAMEPYIIESATLTGLYSAK